MRTAEAAVKSARESERVAERTAAALRRGYYWVPPAGTGGAPQLVGVGASRRPRSSVASSGATGGLGATDLHLLNHPDAFAADAARRVARSVQNALASYCIVEDMAVQGLEPERAKIPVSVALRRHRDPYANSLGSVAAPIHPALEGRLIPVEALAQTMGA